MALPNVVRFSRGFAGLYNSARPHLDVATLSAAINCARGGPAHSPDLVVDIGAGTGLSTLPWAGHARRVIGVEPSDEMRTVAETARHQSNADNVEFVAGTSTATGLPAACADIVTIAQALHWMAPLDATFAEVSRILKPGGVFVAYDADWPPLCGREAESAYDAFCARAEALEASLLASPGVIKENKAAHASRMRASGRFRHVRDIAVHQQGAGSAADLVDLALSQGTVQAVLAVGATHADLGVSELSAAAARCFGGNDVMSKWMFTYRLRIGIV